MSLTTDKNDPRLNQTKDNGQNEAYIVLTEEELAKGFVRPVRTTYVHVGTKTPDVSEQGKLFTLDELHANNPKEYDEERIKKFRDWGYVAYIEYSDEYRQKNDKGAAVGTFIFQKDLDAINSKQKYSGGCGTVTTMHRSIAETYARDPKFYGATFCCGCGKHLPVEEFIWDGTNETVGS